MEFATQQNSRQLYGRLLRYVKPYWKYLATSVAFLVLLAATEPLFPALMKPLLDEGFTNQNELFIKWIPIGLVGLFLIRGALLFTSSYASAWVSNRVVTDLRSEMFSHLMQLPVSFYDQHSSARLSSHIAYDVNNVTGAATSALTVLVRDSLTILGLMIWLLWLDWKLTSITIALFPLIAYIVRYFNRRLRRFSGESQRAMAGITHAIEEAASNNRIIKIFTSQEYESERFREENEKHRRISMRAMVASTAISPLIQLLTSLSVAVIIGVALNNSGAGTATAGGFVSFLTALMMLLPPIKRLSEITAVIQRGLAAAEVVFSILDESAERHSEATKTAKTYPRLQGDIAFKDVSFTYPEAKKPALDQFNLHVEAGKTMALVGRSGSGKSTVTSLLSGFYCLESGQILLDQQSFTELPLSQIRQNIGLVSQDVRLFNNTILHNVAYAEAAPDELRAINALKHAHAWEFVAQLPDGLQTQVGQNGLKLSGGQRQRLAIARAFYKDAPILILDEATSALDTESEQKIQDALNELIQGRTTLIIAHRLSTIEKADQIVVMDHGKIVEQGTHTELLARNGAYTRLHALQEFADE